MTTGQESASGLLELELMDDFKCLYLFPKAGLQVVGCCYPNLGCLEEQQVLQPLVSLSSSLSNLSHNNEAMWICVGPCAPCTSVV